MKNLVLTVALFFFGWGATAQAEVGRDCKKVYRQAAKVYEANVAEALVVVQAEDSEAYEKLTERLEYSYAVVNTCNAEARAAYREELAKTTNNKEVNEAIARLDGSLIICAGAYDAAVVNAKAAYAHSTEDSRLSYEGKLIGYRMTYNATVESCK